MKMEDEMTDAELEALIEQRRQDTLSMKMEVQETAEREGGGEICWLKPVCKDVEGIQAYLTMLGFDIQAVDSEGAWVQTTSGVRAYVNTSERTGYVAAAAL